MLKSLEHVLLCRVEPVLGPGWFTAARWIGVAAFTPTRSESAPPLANGVLACEGL